MSYKKIAKVGEVLANVRFHFLTESLFNEVSVLTQYRAKTIKDGAGKSLSDDYAISENERDIFLLNLNYAINDIFAEVVKQTKGITASIFVNAEVSLPVADAIVGDASGFAVVDHGAFNDNNLTLIDNAIRKAVVNNILKAWYKHNGLQTDMQMAELEYNSAILAINQRMFELKKKLMTD
jgi:hypothetical protein